MKPLRCLLYGFAIWAVATLAFRTLGGVFFRPDIAWVALLLALVAIPGIAGVTLGGFSLLRIEPADRPAAAGLFAAIGMALDAGVIFNWPASYPNLQAHLAGPFGAYMLWCNTVAILTGALSSRAAFAKTVR